MIFLDTGFLYAPIDADDANHARVRQVLEREQARIDGTRICVVDVAIAYQQGHKPEEIQTYPSSRPLTLAEVMSALAYHYDHPEELEAYLGRGQDAEDEYDPRRAGYLRQRSGE